VLQELGTCSKTVFTEGANVVLVSRTLPVVAAVLIRAEVIVATEAVEMISVLTEVFQQRIMIKEIRAVGVTCAAHLEMADIMSAGAREMLCFGQVVYKLSIASFTIFMRTAVDKMLKDSLTIVEIAVTRTTVLRAIIIR
jgi:hypothetical protein